MDMRICPVCDGKKQRIREADGKVVFCDLCKGQGKIPDNRPKT